MSKQRNLESAADFHDFQGCVCYVVDISQVPTTGCVVGRTGTHGKSPYEEGEPL